MTQKKTVRSLFRAACARRSHAPVARPGLSVRGGLRATAAVLGFALQEAHAAGGHHAVDDAAILEPGECQVETWADRERGGDRTLVHVGPACRIGPLEIGVNLDRTRMVGSSAVQIDTGV